MCYPLTPCSSSFISCSVTLGVLRASRRQDKSSSGRRYSSTSLMGSPRVVPCLEVEGTTSSSIEPLKVVSWKDEDGEEEEITGRSVRSKGMHLRNFSMCFELSLEDEVHRWQNMTAPTRGTNNQKKNTDCSGIYDTTSILFQLLRI